MSSNQASTPHFEVFFDGACPLCNREVKFLRWLDRKDRVRFTDIADPHFDAAAFGTSWDALMAEIHGRKADGSWVRGVEVFRELYDAVGWSFLVALSRLPGISHLLEAGYRVFARNRLRLTGRCDAEGCRVPHASAGPSSSC